MKNRKKMNSLLNVALSFTILVGGFPVTNERIAAAESNSILSSEYVKAETKVESPAPSPAPLNTISEQQIEPTFNPGNVQMKSAFAENKKLIDEVVSVTGDVYDPNMLTIQMLREKTYETRMKLVPGKTKENLEKPLARAAEPRSLDLTQTEIEPLVLAGASKVDVYWVNYLSLLQEKRTPLELWKWKLNEKRSWEDIQQELEKEAGIFSKPTVQENVYATEMLNHFSFNGKPTVSSSVYGQEEGTGKGYRSELALSMSTFDAAVSGVINKLALAQINQTYKPQFNDRNSSSEMVDPVSGSVTRKENLIHLPGVDGLDLDIGLMYNSNQSIPFLISTWWDPNFQSWEYSYNYRLPVLGSGWSYQFPYLQRAGDTGFIYHDGTGNAYRVRDDNSNDELSLYTNLLNYKGKDKRLVYENWNNGAFSNGQQRSSSYIEYLDLKREYFSNDGDLIGIVDRFGNTITFKYDESRRLFSITDTVGRVVKFNYEEDLDSEVFDGENVDIRVYNEENATQEVQKVVLTKGRVLGEIQRNIGIPPLQKYIPYLASITDQNGEKTYFEYQNGFSSYVGSYDGFLFNSFLKKITYPNSVTEYEYEQADRHTGPNSTVIEYRAKSRKDKTASKTYQEINYSYTGDYTGNTPDQYPAVLPADFRFSTTSTVVSTTASNGLQTTHTFDKDGRVLRTETREAGGERKITDNTAFHGVFTRYPTRTTLSEYAPQDTEATANHLYTETVYNSWGQVENQTKPLTGDQFNNPAIKQHYTTTYQYEPKYHLLETQSWYNNENDAAPQNERYTYTAEGRPVTVTNALGDRTVYSYSYFNSTGGISQATTEKTAQGQLVAKSVTQYGPEGRRAYPTEQQQWFNIGTSNQQIVKTTMSYEMGYGLLKSQSDENGKTTRYEYDAAGRLKKETYPNRSNANGEVFSEVVEYNYYNTSSANFDAVNTGMPVLKVDSIRTVTQLSNKSVVKTYANVLYNGMGLALLEEHFDDNAGKWVFTQYHYDDMGRPIYQKDALSNEITVGYDAWGQQKSLTDSYRNVFVTNYNLKQRKAVSYLTAAGTSETMNYIEESYDPWGRVISKRTFRDWPNQSQPITERYSYDIIGNLTGYTDPMNHLNEAGVTTHYSYNALNQLTGVKDALNQTTRYSYDGNGQISKVTIQGKGESEQTLNTKSYNEIGLMTTKQDAAAKSESVSYNNLGQQTGKTDRMGSVFSYNYDERGQLKSSSVSGVINNTSATQKIDYIYGDGSPKYRTINSYVNGALRATQKRYLDSMNQVRNDYSVGYSTTGAGGHSSYILNELDVLGRMTQINDSNLGFYVNYQFDSQRLVNVQTNGSASLSKAASDNVQYSYYANGRVKTITYPPLTDGSILKTEYTYNKALGWVESMKNTKGSSVLSGYTYSYDNNGNITAVTEVLNNGAAKTTSYGYDALNRLLSIKRPNGQSTQYTYDVRGNRLTSSESVSTSVDLSDTSYTYDLQNTLTGLTKNGNTTIFTYYADGLRYLKSTGTTHTQVNYDFSGQVIAEEKLSGSTVIQKSSFVRGDRVLVKKDKTAAKDYYYLYNGHGDVVQIVNTSGTPVNTYSYDEWGNITSQTEGIPNSFKYAGEIYDEETGLYYLRARYYDPSIGRFLNEDTVEGQIDNPLSQNLYTYVHNNPLINSDPTGHMPHKLLNMFLSDFIGGRSNGTNYTNAELANAVLNANGNNDSGRYKAFHEIAQIYAAKQIHSESGQAVQLEYHLEEEISYWPNKHHYVDIVTGDNKMWEVKAMRVTHLGLGDGAWEDAEAQLLRYRNVNNQLSRGYQLSDITGIIIVDQLRMDIQFNDLGKIVYSFYLDMGGKGTMPLTTQMASDYVSNSTVYPPSIDIDIKIPIKGRKK
ncbi:RHS repeat-associated core domain-containing protein [Paenibacillus sp. FSL L8-0340]|uniref:RHS repeat protein n=1 Tax=Paenibacillus sp. FSL L8-0340 TaxID=2954685 RepID=UPI003158B9BD